ncbi:Ig-like domain-containing protein [Deinococcus humi]|uniref:PKD domain-containing protein n=1 Tax=Deinococcus humi TaxID=662880 RepID=A0A7W8JVF5_9DEIO|nr:Ig-like domain-containing protein [Deinococcus humi]MBB5363982.1 hypothetical protein [Deinococcus humi]GGO32761.1 hypothetical protein GCM10008949_30850 [Deinococcus humi]
MPSDPTPIQKAQAAVAAQQERQGCLAGLLSALRAGTAPPVLTPAGLPSVQISATPGTITSPGPLTLTLSATNVTRLRLLIDGVEQTEPLSAGQVIRQIEAGTADKAYTYRLEGLDAAGAVLAFHETTVNVELTPVLPTISLGVDSMNFTAAGTLIMTASASSPRGIKNVTFYWGDPALGNVIQVDDESPYAASRPITAADNGTNTVYAVVTDLSSPVPQTAQASQQVTVNIAPAVQLPTLALDKASAVTGATITATLGRLQVDDQLDWGDGTVVAAQTSLTHSYSASGPYTVKVLRGGAAAASANIVISTPVIGITYAPPITISAGGVYSGNWQSVDDRTIPAVNITTTDPVTIHTGHVRGRGDLIRARKTGARVTIRNMAGEGLNPNVAGKPQGRFADLQGLVSALVENCEFDGTGGIYFNGYVGNGTTETFIVRLNFGRNINGRLSDGNGGYMTGQADFYRLQFCQFNHVNGIPGARIERNRTLNKPRESHIEDTVNLSDSTGKSNTDRIIVQDNLFEGAYAWNPAASYSGGGIVLGDGGGRYQEARNNTILETSNYGIAVADGNDMSILNNIILGTGRLADGTLLDADSDAGIYLRDYVTGTPRDPATVLADGNLVGWSIPTATNPNARYDISVQNINGVLQGTLGTNTKMPDGPITQAMLDAARQAWLDSVVAANLTIGRLSA